MLFNPFKPEISEVHRLSSNDTTLEDMHSDCLQWITLPNFKILRTSGIKLAFVRKFKITKPGALAGKCEGCERSPHEDRKGPPGRNLFG